MTAAKSPARFFRHGQSLEAKLEHQQGYLTPVENFFVCNSGSSPRIPQTDYRLRLWGDGLESTTPVELGLDDIRALPQRTVPALIECAGNHRALFQEINAQAIQTPPGTEELIWSLGAVGMAEWTGAVLADVLAVAGVKSAALQVCPRGGETDSVEGEIRIPIDIDKALDPDTLLAIEMNGAPLPQDHGFPVRVLVPGWIGAYSVKWVTDIEVRCKPLWVRRNTESYVLRGEHWPAAHYAPAAGAPIKALNIKSSLALPRPARLQAGMHTLHGYARSPGYRVAAVDWSEDLGETWQPATLGTDNPRYGWVRFHFDWQANAGEQVLMTRATDENGCSQPEIMRHNIGGYLYNAIHPHPVSVLG